MNFNKEVMSLSKDVIIFVILFFFMNFVYFVIYFESCI